MRSEFGVAVGSGSKQRQSPRILHSVLNILHFTFNTYVIRRYTVIVNSDLVVRVVISFIQSLKTTL